MSTSKKHRDFVREPMGDKPVTVLPGIGKVLGDKLEKAGVSRADNVYGQYLVHNKDRHHLKVGYRGQHLLIANKQMIASTLSTSIMIKTPDLGDPHCNYFNMESSTAIILSALFSSYSDKL
ncbi:barrier to autointegration factor [Apostichopus japonicus]|uniref:Barrier to autointegration factor n=1 Tax=Stichopus japonicus TaxID=307972 RepID=A0A2G8L510_STIJA|nr:barrier to autointegration factor [Apostichopus japonicus]